MLNIFANFRSHFEFRRNLSILTLILVFGLAFTACSTNDDIDMSGWTFTMFEGEAISNVVFANVFGTPPTPGSVFPRNLVYGTKSKYEMFAYLQKDRPDKKRVDVPYADIKDGLEFYENILINSTQKQQILDKLASDEYIVIGIDLEIEEGPGMVGILAIFRQ